MWCDGGSGGFSRKLARLQRYIAHYFTLCNGKSIEQKYTIVKSLKQMNVPTDLVSDVLKDLKTSCKELNGSMRAELQSALIKELGPKESAQFWSLVQ